MHDFSRAVGIGSRSHDLVGAVKISFRISSSEAGAKERSLVGSGLAGSWAVPEGGSPEKEERIREILSTKNEPKVLAKSLKEVHSGRTLAGRRWSILSKTPHSACWSVELSRMRSER